LSRRQSEILIKMTIRIKKEKAGGRLLAAVSERSGVDFGVCYQCKKCSSGCPVSDRTAAPPSVVIRRLQLGAGDELLDSDLIWTCVSCATCTARCPMGIDIASGIDALRELAAEQSAAPQVGNIPLFNRAFLKTVQLFGRTYDLGLMAAYKIGTSSYLQDTGKVPVMLKKRKIAFTPSWGANRKLVRRIFKKARQNREHKK
jgi:heterodisulfide reductase subunit C